MDTHTPDFLFKLQRHSYFYSVPADRHCPGNSSDLLAARNGMWLCTPGPGTPAPPCRLLSRSHTGKGRQWPGAGSLPTGTASASWSPKWGAGRKGLALGSHLRFLALSSRLAFSSLYKTIFSKKRENADW